MSTLDCSKFLETQRLGHLACTMNDKPYVVPIYFAIKGTHLYCFSMPGKKVDIMRQNPHVAMVVESFSDHREWKSVHIEGQFEELPDRIGSKVEREHAWTMLSKFANWWEPGGIKPDTQPVADHSAHLFYRIVIGEMTGRESAA
ncbi:pyridoxamine 5'-phosphate oxidase family protein [Mesorhizobium sp. NBSH29]|uniref:pyridoxamine 5'-phosphate oxidase family protein n=1 Tax=Mesorhizobium sp. NBSH29 TaxID=2654249 RepID=UPI0021560491|nr:pyridoxamine 5'-phosphate oxidase family protein [Mesorhizobium sp. NBSH29]